MPFVKEPRSESEPMNSAVHKDMAERAFSSASEALEAILTCLSPVAGEGVDLRKSCGRVLASPLISDRDSPACDVSQMDGYAVRLADLDGRALPVAGEASLGHAPITLSPGAAARIFTGAPIPHDADTIIPREEVAESDDTIRLLDPCRPVRGRYIRRRGENLGGCSAVVVRGTMITPAVMSALASFGTIRPHVHRRVRAAIIVTGNELLGAGDHPEPWQVRDANGYALCGLLNACPWLKLHDPIRVPDDPDRLRGAIMQALAQSDALLTTGGVSMGRYDHVPDLVRSLGGRIVFHKLPIRPGKPVLGAIGPEGQLVVGLPGNPVSVMVTARRLAMPALQRMAGLRPAVQPSPAVRLVNSDGQSLGLNWFRPVQLIGPGEAELVSSRGSGDVVSLARSDGFVEIPTGGAGEGPWPYYAWSS